MRINLKLDPQIRKDGTQTVLIHINDGGAGCTNWIRKKISTKIRINKKHFDFDNFRVEKRHSNQQDLNRAIKQIKERQETALINYETEQWSLDQVILYLKGDHAYESVDDYIETVIKGAKSTPTYNDYKYTLRAFKKHLQRKDLISFNELANFNVLDRFKYNAQLNGLSPASINSYFKKIRALLNDAYDRKVIHKKFTLNKKFIEPVRPKELQTITAENFKDAVNKIKTIHEWQSLAFYLLMFSTRGMLQADIINFRWNNFAGIDTKYSWGNSDAICAEGYDYLIHRRSKTRATGNADMYIRLDTTIVDLIVFIKWSIVYTHYKSKPEIVAPITDPLAIFNYDLNKDYLLHSNLWDTYEKKIKKLLGFPYKTARKTFNTVALELAVSDTIRRVLLGHADPTMLSHYDNTQTKLITQQVDDAHLSVLKEFKVNELYDLLKNKLSELDVPKWVCEYDVWFREPTKKEMERYL